MQLNFFIIQKSKKVLLREEQKKLTLISSIFWGIIAITCISILKFVPDNSIALSYSQNILILAIFFISAADSHILSFELTKHKIRQLNLLITFL